MPKSSIYLDSGLWRRELSEQRDPLQLFPELFNVNATGRSDATELAGVGPEFEVAETNDGFSLNALVPGVTAAQLQVLVTAQLVIVLHEQATPPVGVSVPESNQPAPRAAFRKTFVLPTAVDARRLQVALVGDLVTITLPKRTPGRTKRAKQTAR